MRVARSALALAVCLALTGLAGAPAQAKRVVGGSFEVSASFAGGGTEPEVIISGRVLTGGGKLSRRCLNRRRLAVFQSPGAVQYPGTIALAETRPIDGETSARGTFTFRQRIDQFDIHDPENAGKDADVDDGGGVITFRGVIAPGVRGFRRPVKCKRLEAPPVSVTIPPSPAERP
jgi:hypothetical protein